MYCINYVFDIWLDPVAFFLCSFGWILFRPEVISKSAMFMPKPELTWFVILENVAQQWAKDNESNRMVAVGATIKFNDFNCDDKIQFCVC